MTGLAKAGLIWNRACDFGPLPLLAGDLALAAMLVVHGRVENGGVFHAAEDADRDQLIDGQLGYRFFGLDLVADLLAEAKLAVDAERDLEELEAEFNHRYAALVPGDSALFERFEAVLRRDPSQFAPLWADG